MLAFRLILVTSSNPSVSIVSLTEVKAHLKITTTQNDEVLRFLSLAASDACESAEGTNKCWRRQVITGEKHTGGHYAIELLSCPGSVGHVGHGG